MSVWFLVLCWIVSTIAIAGNTTVIYVILTRKTLRTTANIFISSLAASDLGVGLCVILGSYFARNSSNEETLEIFDIFYAVFFTASVVNLCIMTVDRYIAIALPYRYLALMSRRRVVVLVLFSWLVPISTSLIPLLWRRNDEEQVREAKSVFYLSISASFVLISYTILIPATLHVYLITKRHFHRINTVNLQLKFNHGRQVSFRAVDVSSSKLLMFASIVFIFCYSSQLWQDICDLCCNCFYFPDLAVFLLLLNSAINSFFYALHKRDIKKELKIVLKPSCSY